MRPYQISVMVGSLRQDSLNRRFGSALVKLARAEFAFKQLQIAELPLYNQDEDGKQVDLVRHLKAEILASDGIIFITPEYNRSIPGVLKNAIDHASRPYGESAWSGKPAGILGVSPGPMGTAMAQQHLRNVLASLDMPTLGQPEVFIKAGDSLFDGDGNIGPAYQTLLQSWMRAYQSWVILHGA